jgi:hypothetical protein
VNANPETWAAVLDALKGADSLDPIGPLPTLARIATWTPDELSEVSTWAEDRRECARAQVEQDLAAPVVLEAWLAEQDPEEGTIDAEPAPAPTRLSYLPPPPPPPPPFDPEVWRRPDGTYAKTAAERQALYEDWTDPERFRVALQDPKLQQAIQAQMRGACGDLKRIREFEQSIREAGPKLWTCGSAIYSGLEIMPEQRNYKVTAGVKAECARVLLIPEQLEAERARTFAASQVPASPAEEPPSGGLAEQLLQLRSEDWRGGDDPELTALLRAVVPLRAVLDCDPDLDGAEVLGRAVREIEDLRRALDRRDDEAADLRIEIDRLRAAPPAAAPSWHPDGDGGLAYSAPPPILARVEPDADDAAIWYWSVGGRRGTAGSSDDARAIADLFLTREAK